MKIQGFSWIPCAALLFWQQLQLAEYGGIMHSQQCCQFCWICCWGSMFISDCRGGEGGGVIWSEGTGPCFLTGLAILLGGTPRQLFCSVLCSYLDYTSGRRKPKHSKASEQQRGACLQAGTKLTLLNRIWEASAGCLNCLVWNKCFLWSKSKAEHTDLGCTLQIFTMSQLPPYMPLLPLCAGWTLPSVVTWLLNEAKIMLDEIKLAFPVIS